MVIARRQISGLDNKMTYSETIATVHSSAVPGKKVFVQPDGTLGYNYNEYPVGFYLSDTELRLIN